MARTTLWGSAALSCTVLLLFSLASPVSAAKPLRRAKASGAGSSESPLLPKEVASQVDAIIAGNLKKDGIEIAGRCLDEDFLRRVSLDITGVTPSPQEVTLFGFESSSDKRARLVDRLLEDADYGKNWARYWRDVIYLRATSQFGNLGRSTFETWMADQLQKNEPWDKVATSILTATGKIQEVGQTALFAVHQAEPDEVAAEASRIFLGIQLQCANCHDQPTDHWKREQFHQLAAFFPRVRFDRRLQAQPPVIQIVSLEGNADGQDFRERLRALIADPAKLMATYDRNGDKKITRSEVQRFGRGGAMLEPLFNRGDTDKDGALTLAEIKNFPTPMMRTGQGSLEYHMPDLNNPQSPGTKVNPSFFLSKTRVEAGLSDLGRRTELAKELTSPDNPWFAKAMVNRMWGALLGEGFFMPVDDMGPDRTPSHPEALDALASAFALNHYDVKWLIRTITSTDAYQRQIRHKDPTKVETFAHAIPTRLRADQLYSSLLRVMGTAESTIPTERIRMPGAGARFGDQSPRGQFNQLFGFDPSTAPDDLNGTVPQALFLMNGRELSGLLRAGGSTRLGDILRKFSSDKDAVIELFLLVHTREPSPSEQKACLDYIQHVNNRQEAFEDLMWTLINSTEFLTKR
jgi:hypothetical protein